MSELSCESKCVCCGNEVPVFDPRVSPELAQKAHELLKIGQYITAVKEVRFHTGMDLRDAKYWVDHCGQLAGRAEVTGSCPYCGLELRTEMAKQCRHCKRDWHDSENVKFL